ncbi:MAG: DUF3795 domain-containing protein [Candidatus Lokiarchaeota archaeon]|nr:DUF3795 domain-containing protein [Candidatus Lokiarchaeota archaeon]
MNKKWNLSFCGLNCVACEIYLASHGDVELHDELVKWFQENVDSSITSISCEQCRGEQNKCWTPDCFFRNCATQRGHTYCFECEDFVCTNLDAFAKTAPHHSRTIKNMRKMKEMGVKEWIASQNEVKFCP